MDDLSYDEDQRMIEQLRTSISRLADQPDADIDELAGLADQARKLVNSSNSRITGEAQSLELRVLGAMLCRQAAIMRQLAHKLLRAARMLPTPSPELN